MTPRGIRLNNPGNLRHGAAWAGLAAVQPDPDFCAFVDPESGIRAMAKVLLKYEADGIRTVRGIISRYAPPTENDTQAYIDHVAKQCNVSPDYAMDVKAQLPNLVPAIILHEQGIQPYSLLTIMEGILRATGQASPVLEKPSNQVIRISSDGLRGSSDVPAKRSGLVQAARALWARLCSGWRRDSGSGIPKQPPG